VSVVFLRVDDRLIHGQVVVGWGQALSPHRIILADDAIAQDAWEAELYRAAVPDDVEVDFVSVANVAEQFASLDKAKDRTIVIVRDVDTLIRLGDLAHAVRAVNLGGLHRAGERIERLPYLYLTEAELTQLKRLERQGIEITAQDLPNAMPVTLSELE
jgi:D-glucosaminate PTS system EIIB component